MALAVPPAQRKKRYVWSCCELGVSSHLFQAACDGDVDVVEKALRIEPLLILHKGLGGLRDTAWHLAAANGHADVLQALCRHLEAHLPLVTAELIRRQRWPFEPLTPAQAVIRATNLTNVKGQTPLMFASFAGHANCVAVLIAAGADPWIYDNCGRRSALHYAALHGYVSCVTTILEQTPQPMLSRTSQATHNGVTTMLVNQHTISGFTPLHYAAYSKVPGTCQALLERGANLLAMSVADGVYDIITCPRWTTPLHVIAWNGFQEGAREILRHYLACRDSGQFRDPRLSRDKASRLPYHVARLHGHVQLAELLHPALNLDTVFPSGEIELIGVPKLSLLASRVLQQLLLRQVDTADAQIAQLPLLEQPLGALSVRKGSLVKNPTQILQPNGSGIPTLDTVVELESGAGSPPVTSPGAAGPSTRVATVSRQASGLNPAMDGPPPLRQQASTVQRLMQRLSRVSRPWGASNDGTADPGAAVPRAGLSRADTAGKGGLSRADTGLKGGRNDVGRGSVEAAGAGTPTRGSTPPRPPRSPEPEPAWWGGNADDNGPQQWVSPFSGATRGGSPEREPDWWTANGTSAMPPAPVLGAPIPNDRTADAVIPRAPSLLDRMRSIGKVSRRRPGVGMQDSERGGAGVHDTGEVRGGSPLSDRGRAGVGGVADVSPFAAISWGTSAMIASLPSQDTCSVCLEEVYALVLVPCLHRSCAPCARLMVMAMKGKPLVCPVCRSNVRAAFAPTDTEALEHALNMHKAE